MGRSKTREESKKLIKQLRSLDECFDSLPFVGRQRISFEFEIHVQVFKGSNFITYLEVSDPQVDYREGVIGIYLQSPLPAFDGLFQLASDFVCAT